MPKLKVAAFSLSLDGFGAGPSQDLANPLGVRGLELHKWFFQTEIFNQIDSQSKNSNAPNAAQASAGTPSGTAGVDNDFAKASFDNVGAWILGRNMFGPVRGPWLPDPKTGELWQGWWGPNPPYHVPVFVLTHHAREPLRMEGGTTFYFVTAGIDSALQKAAKAAGDKDVRVGGGVSTIRQFLLAGHIDELHLALSPVFLGEGENLFAGINLAQLGFTSPRIVVGENATHLLIERSSNKR